MPIGGVPKQRGRVMKLGVETGPDLWVLPGPGPDPNSLGIKCMDLDPTLQGLGSEYTVLV